MRRLTPLLMAVLMLSGCSTESPADIARSAIDSNGGPNMWHVEHEGDGMESGTVDMSCDSSGSCELHSIPYELYFDDDGTVLDFRLMPESGGR